MHTTDGWGTVYKIDIRNPNRAQFVWTAEPGVKHEGNRPQTRGIALWEDMVIVNAPDGRVLAINRDTGEVVWDKKLAIKTEFGGQEKFAAAPLVADGKVIIQNGAGDAGTRGCAPDEDRQRVVALVCGAEARRSRQRTWRVDHNA
jgi:alcohol dehydrogenase (cytochrome c)